MQALPLALPLALGLLFAGFFAFVFGDGADEVLLPTLLGTHDGGPESRLVNNELPPHIVAKALGANDVVVQRKVTLSASNIEL